MQPQLENHAPVNKNPVISRHETKQTLTANDHGNSNDGYSMSYFYLWYSRPSNLNDNLCDQTIVVVVIMMMMMKMSRQRRRRRNSILTAKICADRHTTQSSALSVPTVSNNVFNITQQHETEYLK